MVVGSAGRNGLRLRKIESGHQKTEACRRIGRTARSLQKRQEIAGSMSIESLTEALATVVKELSRRSTIFTDGRLCTYGLQFKAPRLGNGWRVARRINMGRLVQSIGELTRHYGLPTGTRRDYETRHADEENSQFVLLIKELQKHLPKDAASLSVRAAGRVIS